jgi:hypothetical protein
MVLCMCVLYLVGVSKQKRQTFNLPAAPSFKSGKVPLTNISNATVKRSRSASIAPPVESPRPQHVQANASQHDEMGFRAMHVNTVQQNQPPLARTPTNSIAPPPSESPRPQHVQANTSQHDEMGFRAMPVNTIQSTHCEPVHSSFTSLGMSHCSRQMHAAVKFQDLFDCQRMDNLQRDQGQLPCSSDISLLPQSNEVEHAHDGMSFRAMLMDNISFDRSELVSVSGSSFVESPCSRDVTSATSQQQQVYLQTTPRGNGLTDHSHFDLSGDLSTLQVQITNAPPSSLSGKLEFIINIVNEIWVNQQELQRSVTIPVR